LSSRLSTWRLSCDRASTGTFNSLASAFSPGDLADLLDPVLVGAWRAGDQLQVVDTIRGRGPSFRFCRRALAHSWAMEMPPVSSMNRGMD
jgi:hypothetical protein